MVRKKKDKQDIINPHMIVVKEWNLYGVFYDDDAITISFDGETVFLSKENFIQKHPGVHSVIQNYNTVDLRCWEHRKIITFWIYEIDNVQMLKAFKESVVNGNVKEVTKEGVKETCSLNLDIENLEIIFCTKIGDVTYVNKAKIDELDDTCNNMVSNHEKRISHTSSPTLKYELTLRDAELKNDRDAYFKEMDRIWTKKHGNMDVAEYHLLMYEE